jgi:hypothetical protein
MAFSIVPIAEDHIDGFRAVVDSVARERRYLALLEAPPPEESRKFVAENIRKRCPHYVALGCWPGGRVARRSNAREPQG